MNKVFAFVKTELLYNGHLQSLGAVSLVYLSSLYIYEFIPSFWLLLATYLLFQAIYFYDRLRDLGKDEQTNSVRVKHIRQYSKYLPGIIVLSLVLAIGILYTKFNFAAVAFFVIVFLLGYLYPLYMKGLTKSICLFKNIYVSGVHAVLVIFPFLATGFAVANNSLLYIFPLYIFLEAMIIQVLLDAKDTKSDKEEGLLTLPVLIGAEKTIYVSLVGSVISMALIFSFLPGLAVFGFLINALVVYLFTQKKMAGFFIGAGKFLLWSIFQIL